ncbi:MAG: 23S rRNA (uracil(1939)-C(5))-methyltransferase RlmD [Clostridia bacterium]|nr:23S rRNA (uracil(1939)-C(5))-methyltransferase RlmD [Clostridia bacterium]
MLNKNQEITLRIKEVNHLGYGVARAEDGQVVFVGGAIDGELVRAKVIRAEKNYAVARTEEILEHSPYREEDFCAVKGCGGCAYRRMTYAREREIKRKHVLDCFCAEGLAHIPVEELRFGEKQYAYRNKAQYPVGQDSDGRVFFGFFAPKSHRVVEASHCALQPPAFARILDTLGRWFTSRQTSVYDEKSHTGLLRHIYLRQSAEGNVLLTIVINGDWIEGLDGLIGVLNDHHPEVVGVWLNLQKKKTNVICSDEYVHIWGEKSLTDTLCGVSLSLAPAAFYQVNHEMAAALYEEARRRAALTGNELLLDLYCGVGSIGLSMARDVRELIGIEVVPDAVACAAENADRNGITNASFYVGDAADAENLLACAEDSRGAKIMPDAVVLDPPRKGCDEKLLSFLASRNVPRIIYISCNPRTLARDVAILTKMGYEADKVTPFDLFPRTAHVESVVSLTRAFDVDMRR